MEKKLHIKQLQVSNFKGLKEFTLDVGEADAVTVLGDNGTGKTTLVDAWCWLLFGKDSAGRSAFEVKPLGATGEPVHGIEHVVSATLLRRLPDPNCPDHGQGYHCTCTTETVELRKIYKELWTKKRGTAAREFTGNTTDHFVDGVPLKKAEYQAKVAELCDEDAFRILTEPGYFAEQVAWQDRRQVVLNVCGDIDDASVCASDTGLVDLPDLMGKRTIDELRKVANARRRKINQELERIPVRISEVELGQPDTPEDESEVTARLDSFQSARRQAQEDHARISSGGQAGELTNELRTIEADIQSTQTAMRITAEEAVGPKRRAHSDAEEVLRQATSTARLARAAVEDANSDIASNEVLVETAQKRWQDVNALEFDGGDIEDKCPTCKRKLAASKVKAAQDEALANFNEDKATRLQAIEVDEARHEAKVNELRQQLSIYLVPQAASADEAVVDADKQLESAKAALAEVQTGDPDFASNPKWSKLATRKGQVKGRIEQLKNEDVDTLQEVKERIDAMDKAIDRDKTIAARFEQKRAGKKRIKDLKASERKLASEFEDLERTLYLTDKFTRTKVSLLETRINEYFKLARFKMFKVLVNGGLEECCEVTYKGVPYSSNLNHGARVQVGLDIISTLQRHYGFAPPVWVDQSESITWLPEVNCQLIQLVVSDEHDKLTPLIAEA